MATRIEPTATRSQKSGVAVLGRSAATGRLVMKPVSNPDKVTVGQIRAAVASLRDGAKT